MIRPPSRRRRAVIVRAPQASADVDLSVALSSLIELDATVDRLERELERVRDAATLMCHHEVRCRGDDRRS